MTEARTALMQMLNGAWACQAVSSVARLGVPDRLAEFGALTAYELVHERGVEADPAFLERTLRACASLGVFSEDAQGRFGPTLLSELLTASSPGSMRRFAELYGGRWWELWGGLFDVVKQGRQTSSSEFHFDEDEAHISEFGEAMRSRLGSLIGGLERCDLSSSRTLVDVGGGFGHLAIWLLERHPELRAVVLDLPAVARVAQRRMAREEPDVAKRLSFVGGDMFEDVPPGDAYLLSGILHDWDDERCIRLLHQCGSRIGAGGRIFCLDAVLPPLGNTRGSSAKLLDLLMMLSLPGKERTEAEWRALFERAGLVLESIAVYDERSQAGLVIGARRA